MFEMNDGDARDEKIIAVPLGDPNYNYMFDISQLPEHLLDEIRHFFTVYKELEGQYNGCQQSAEPRSRQSRHRRVHQ